jgi:hypothetical protein
MTDNEIIKALELESTPMERNCIHAEYEEACGIWCAKKHKLAENCAECEEHKLGYYGVRAAAALDLIKRQKEEIEVLAETLNATIEGQKTLQRYIEVARAEAVKEFAALLVSKAKSAKERFLLESLVKSVMKEMGVER